MLRGGVVVSIGKSGLRRQFRGCHHHLAGQKPLFQLRTKRAVSFEPSTAQISFNLSGFLGRFGSSSEKMASAKEFVESQLNGSKKVVMFSKSWCPYCTRAKSILSKYPIDKELYDVIEIEDRDDCGAIQTFLQKLTGSRTVPQLFIGGKCIGGADDTNRADKDGSLKTALTSAGAIKA